MLRSSASAQELRYSDIAPTNFGQFELDSADWSVSSANRNGVYDSGLDYEFRGDRYFTISASWAQSAPAGRDQGEFDFLALDSSRAKTLYSRDNQALVNIHVWKRSRMFTDASLEKLALSILGRIETLALPWPEYVPIEELPERVGRFGLDGWDYDVVEFGAAPLNRKLEIRYVDRGEKGDILATYRFQVTWVAPGDTFGDNVTPESGAEIQFGNYNRVELVIHPERWIYCGHYFNNDEEFSGTEAIQFDKIGRELPDMLAHLAVVRKDRSSVSGGGGVGVASDSDSGNTTGRSQSSTASTNNTANPSDNSSSNQPLQPDDIAVVTLLTALILAGTAAGLSLAQAIANAIAAALQAGIEVTSEHVTEAVMNATASQPEAEEQDDAKPEPVPIELPPLFDSQGDELPTEGDRYVWGDRLVTREEAERLIEQERRELEAENQRRLDRHQRQADADWNTQQARARHEAEQARLAAERRQEELSRRTWGALKTSGRWLHDRPNRENQETLGQRFWDGANRVWGGGGDTGTYLPPKVATPEERERFQELLSAFHRGEITREQFTQTQIFAEELIQDGQLDAMIFAVDEKMQAQNAELAATASQVVAEIGKTAATGAAGGGRLAQMGADLIYTSLQNADKGPAGALGRGALSAGLNFGSDKLGLDEIGSRLPLGQRIATQSVVQGGKNVGEGAINHVVDNGSLEGYGMQNVALDMGMGALGGAMGASSSGGSDVDLDSSTPTMQTRPNTSHTPDLDRTGRDVDVATPRIVSPDDLEGPTSGIGTGRSDVDAPATRSTTPDNSSTATSDRTSTNQRNTPSSARQGIETESSSTGRRPSSAGESDFDDQPSPPPRSRTAPRNETDSPAPTRRTPVQQETPETGVSRSPDESATPHHQRGRHSDLDSDGPDLNSTEDLGLTSSRGVDADEPQLTNRGVDDGTPTRTRDDLRSQPPLDEHSDMDSPHSTPDADDSKLQPNQVDDPSDLEPGRWHADQGSNELRVVNPETGKVEVHQLKPGEMQRVPGTTQMMWHNPETGEIEILSRNTPLSPFENRLDPPVASGADAELRNLNPGDEIPDELRPQTGYSDGQITEANRILDQEEAILLARATNMASREKIASGLAVPKPEWIKSKTITELDTYLGRVSSEDIGLVGYFRPREPDYGKIPVDLRADVKARYEFRLKEYNKLHSAYVQLIAEGQMVMENGKLFKILPNGQRKPFAGDIDPVAILDRNTGRPLSGERYGRVLRRLKTDARMEAVGAIQHGAEANLVTDVMSRYSPDDSGYKEKFESMLELQQALETNHIDYREVVIALDGKTIRRGPNLTHLPMEV
ncbi:hypothetical protein [Thalassoglobus neptunius]|nr:hypothetical protein [Thalassoglobus neptunius]